MHMLSEKFKSSEKIFKQHVQTLITYTYNICTLLCIQDVRKLFELLYVRYVHINIYMCSYVYKMCV